ncbi:uncharacterized protein LOC133832074 [Humulus lupulus]|uniref:uncharacterized protein LOC133832074 n=1 Tax=Humulus lupulus TaxID=3486 RepID=UPI002B411C8F|nr:uncharacterized protein LOC133832074 [Humulus lupulus]
MQTDSLRSVNPSFNGYSSSGTGNLADIAARVVNEFRQENGSNGSIFGLEDDYEPWEFGEVNQGRSLITIPDVHREEEGEEEESEFEFAFVATEPDSSPISADEIFYNGQIKPVYPLFDQSLLLEDKVSLNDVVVKKNEETVRRTRRPPLRKLMVEEEREATTSSCSSSEADELDGLKQGTYCVWKPKNGDVTGSESERRNKCGSTGSSRRWKLRDILSRSRSVGKEGLLFAPSIKKVGSSKRTGKEETAVPGAAENEKLKNGVVPKENGEGGKIKNKDEDRKRTTYKQDFVGFLANVNGLSRNLHPF